MRYKDSDDKEENLEFFPLITMMSPTINIFIKWQKMPSWIAMQFWSPSKCIGNPFILLFYKKVGMEVKPTLKIHIKKLEEEFESLIGYV